MVLTVLAPAVTFRAILIVIPNYLQGIGDSLAGFWCTVASAAVFVPAFVIGCYWGTVGVAAAWLIAYPVVYVLNAAIAAKRGGLDFWAMLAVPLRPIALGIIMFMAVAVVRNMLPPSMPVISVLAILVCTGAVTYCAGVMLLARDIAQEMRQLLLREPSPAG